MAELAAGVELAIGLTGGEELLDPAVDGLSRALPLLIDFSVWPSLVPWDIFDKLTNFITHGLQKYTYTYAMQATFTALKTAIFDQIQGMFSHNEQDIQRKLLLSLLFS